MKVIIEFIQQKRNFNCEHGTIVKFANNNEEGKLIFKQARLLNKIKFHFHDLVNDKDSIIKIANMLNSKSMSLADLLKIVNPQNTTIIDKKEFIRRLKVKSFTTLYI